VIEYQLTPLVIQNLYEIRDWNSIISIAGPATQNLQFAANLWGVPNAMGSFQFESLAVLHSSGIFFPSK
jgi:hypothetical protein